MPTPSDVPGFASLPVRPLWPGPGLPPSARTARGLCELSALAAAAAFSVPLHELNAPTRRNARAAFARQGAMYLAHVAFSLSYTEVGRGFGRDRTTVAHACRLVEERRDEPAVDAVLGSLESACADLRRRLSAEVRP